METDHGHSHGGHDHSHEPITKVVPKQPEHVLRLIALGETLGKYGVTVVEDGRLKADELSAKGLNKGLPYFEKRLMSMRGVLADKNVVSQEEVEQKKDQLKKSQKGSDFELRVLALTNLLVEKGLVTNKDIDARYEIVRARTPMTGAKIIARAWVDPEFKAKLKQDAKAAITEMGPNLLDANNGEPVDTWNITRLEVIENTEKVRNVIVCTLCSCYPRGILGEPPEWYTSESYRDRIVKEPRKVLAEMGTKLSDDVETKVYDSSADIRYLVIPIRPKGTEGMTEAQLAELVTRDSLIGVTDPVVQPQK
jgi:nitrile hydratase